MRQQKIVKKQINFWRFLFYAILTFQNMTENHYHPVTTIWKVAPTIPPEIEARLSDYHPTIRQLLYNRGITTAAEAERYINPKIDYTHDPLLLLNMEAAVERIEFAIQRHERIAIYGDYDVDGVTATTILSDYLKRRSADVIYHIPNRFEEGYGVRSEAIDGLKEQGVRLIITVDCGVRSSIETEHAKSIGLDMIITDHHQPLNELPDAIAIINPKQPNDPYPFKELAGVGVAYKLIQGYQKLKPIPHLQPEDYLDLLALGTIADMVPLVDENRTLARIGLDKLRSSQRAGIRALITIAGLTPPKLSAQHISHLLAPRLNAAGRLESAMAALNLLLTDDTAQASKLAQELDDQNRKRQKLTHHFEAIATELALIDEENPYILVAANPEFNLGVIGLVASRLCERFYRPAIVATINDEFIRGSCRSIPELNITETLDECVDLMEHHGGHAAAAGFTIKRHLFPELVNRLKHITESRLKDSLLQPTITADIELDLHKGINFYNDLELLQPTGINNPAPLFITRNLTPQNMKKVGKEYSHLRFQVNNAYPCIAFRKGDLLDNLPEKIDILYTIEQNDFNGNSYLQLVVRDIKPSS